MNFMVRWFLPAFLVTMLFVGLAVAKKTDDNLLENPFPPPPSMEEARLMLGNWNEEDVISQLKKVNEQLVELKNEIKKMRRECK